MFGSKVAYMLPRGPRTLGTWYFFDHTKFKKELLALTILQRSCRLRADDALTVSFC